jgi:hypothetical protein
MTTTIKNSKRTTNNLIIESIVTGKDTPDPRIIDSINRDRVTRKFLQEQLQSTSNDVIVIIRIGSFGRSELPQDDMPNESSNFQLKEFNTDGWLSLSDISNSDSNVVIAKLDTPLETILESEIACLALESELHILEINADGLGSNEYRVIKLGLTIENKGTDA